MMKATVKARPIIIENAPMLMLKAPQCSLAGPAGQQP
jgi:hypothetical protein